MYFELFKLFFNRSKCCEHTPRLFIPFHFQAFSQPFNSISAWLSSNKPFSNWNWKLKVRKWKCESESVKVKVWKAFYTLSHSLPSFYPTIQLNISLDLFQQTLFTFSFWFFSFSVFHFIFHFPFTSKLFPDHSTQYQLGSFPTNPLFHFHSENLVGLRKIQIMSPLLSSWIIFLRHFLSWAGQSSADKRSWHSVWKPPADLFKSLKVNRIWPEKRNEWSGHEIMMKIGTSCTLKLNDNWESVFTIHIWILLLE